MPTISFTVVFSHVSFALSAVWINGQVDIPLVREGIYFSGEKSWKRPAPVGGRVSRTVKRYRIHCDFATIGWRNVAAV
jgi:hypothetical protein